MSAQGGRQPQPGEVWTPKRRTRGGAAEFTVSEVADDMVRGHLWFPGSSREIRFTRCMLRGFLLRYKPPPETS